MTIFHVANLKFGDISIYRALWGSLEPRYPFGTSIQPSAGYLVKYFSSAVYFGG